VVGLALTVRVILSGLLVRMILSGLLVRMILSTFPVPERLWVTELGLPFVLAADDRLLVGIFICLTGLPEEDPTLPVVDLGLLR
jgi:hypothetical protein